VFLNSPDLTNNCLVFLVLSEQSGIYRAHCQWPKRETAEPVIKQ